MTGINLRDKNNTFKEYNCLLEDNIDWINGNRDDIIELEESERKGIQVHSIPNSIGRLENLNTVTINGESYYQYAIAKI